MPDTIRFPAEWEPHDATWVAWPVNETDWPGKFEPIKWVYAEIVRLLAESELVEVFVRDEAMAEEARECLDLHLVPAARYRLHFLETDRGWMRDAAPTAVSVNGKFRWTKWLFNAWAKYDNYHFDRHVPDHVAKISEHQMQPALWPDGSPVVMEGGALETDGEGTLLVTEECLLSEVQCRNPGKTREDYNSMFRAVLGIEKVIWLDSGCAGDDTHGHIDDIARFVGNSRVLLACEDDPKDGNFASSQENLRRLQSATDAKGRKLQVTKLPFPKPVFYGDEILPASYANFYIANTSIIVPTFNDPNDRVALNVLQEVFPNRKVVGLAARDLVLGQGTLHCLTQQQPRLD